MVQRAHRLGLTQQVAVWSGRHGVDGRLDERQTQVERTVDY